MTQPTDPLAYTAPTTGVQMPAAPSPYGDLSGSQPYGDLSGTQGLTASPYGDLSGSQFSSPTTTPSAVSPYGDLSGASSPSPYGDLSGSQFPGGATNTDPARSYWNTPPDFSDECGTCGAVKQADRTSPTTVNYEDVNLGPGQFTHYTTPDGSLNMYGATFAPTSTGVGAGAGECIVTPVGANATVASQVGGLSSGASGSMGTGIAGSVSGNSSGFAACTGLTLGSPGVSSTIGYTATPSDWASILTPTPEQADAMYRQIP